MALNISCLLMQRVVVLNGSQSSHFQGKMLFVESRLATCGGFIRIPAFLLSIGYLESYRSLRRSYSIFWKKRPLLTHVCHAAHTWPMSLCFSKVSGQMFQNMIRLLFYLIITVFNLTVQAYLTIRNSKSSLLYVFPLLCFISLSFWCFAVMKYVN